MKAFWVFALILIASVGAIWLFATKLRLRKWARRVCERMLLGLALVLLASALLSPFGLNLSKNPLTILSAGFFGVPGVISCLILTGL